MANWLLYTMQKNNLFLFLTVMIEFYQYIFRTWDNKHSRDTLVPGALICWVGLKQ